MLVTMLTVGSDNRLDISDAADPLSNIFVVYSTANLQFQCLFQLPGDSSWKWVAYVTAFVWSSSHPVVTFFHLVRGLQCPKKQLISRLRTSSMTLEK